MHKNSTSTILQKAQEAVQNGNYDSAQNEYLKALKEATRARDKAMIWMELAWLFYRQQDFSRTLEALENVERFDEQYESREEIYRLRGFACIGLAQYGDAIDALEQSLRIDRNAHKQQFAIFELAKAYFIRKRYDRAEPLLEEVDAFFYQNNREYWLAIRFYKGFVLYYNKKTADAEKIFEELLEHAEDKKRKAMGLYGLAFIAFDHNNWLKTINLCETVMNNDPDFPDKETVGFLTAASFHNLGRDDIFEQYYQQLIKMFPDGRYRKELDKIRNQIQKADNDKD